MAFKGDIGLQRGDLGFRVYVEFLGDYAVVSFGNIFYVV